jgi:positive phototaxis protein PixI
VSELFSQSNLLVSRTNIAQKKEEEQFLRFHQSPGHQVMLPVKQITEVLKIDVGQIIPIPQMPPWVMGVYNWRGDILWMLDLGHLIGFDSWYQREINTSSYTAIVLAPNKKKQDPKNQDKGSENLSLGLIITRVEDIEWCDTETIQSPPASAVTSTLAPFLRGYWLKQNGEMILALDGQAILAAMPRAVTN